MRAVTLSDSEVIAELDETFVTTWFNQAEDLFPASANHRQPLPPEEYLATFPDGGGGPNVKLFFCDPQGRLVHFIEGQLKKASFRSELGFVKSLLGAMEAVEDPKKILAGRHDERIRKINEDLKRSQRSPLPADKDARRRRAQGIAFQRIQLANHLRAKERLLADPRPWMINESRGIV